MRTQRLTLRGWPGGALVGCALGAALLALAPATLGYDPWGWLAWGREAARLDLATGTSLSWKPLPVLLTTPISLLGDLAPHAWLLGVRFAGLLAVVLAFRLASRLGGRAAGALAVGALLLVPGWMRYLALGNLEPVLAALALGAAAAYWEGRPRAAFGLMGALALARPEAWPLLAVLGAQLWRSQPTARPLVVGAAAAVPALWFGPDWLAAGDPLAGGGVALAAPEALALQASHHPLLEAIRRALDLLLAPLWVAAVLAVRSSSPTVRILVLSCFAWIAAVVVLAGAGYAGLSRFSLPAAAVLGVLGAGVGVDLARRAPRPVRMAAPAALAALLALAAAPRLGRLDEGWREARDRAVALDTLVDSVQRAGGERVVAACRRVTVDGPFHTALAWRYDLELNRLGDRASTSHPRLDASRSQTTWVVRGAGCPPRERRASARLAPRRAGHSSLEGNEQEANGGEEP